MADHIILEPSYKLHLILGFPGPKQDLKFQVSPRTWNPNEYQYDLQTSLLYTISCSGSAAYRLAISTDIIVDKNSERNLRRICLSY